MSHHRSEPGSASDARERRDQSKYLARREFLGLAGTAALAALATATGCGGGGDGGVTSSGGGVSGGGVAAPPASTTTVASELNLLREPETIRSAGRTLQTTMTVKYASNPIPGTSRTVYTRTYNGGIPGPTLRFRAGDRLLIDIDNQLPPNPDPMPANINIPHHFNTTNLHTHGLHVTPQGNADNVLREMEPGTVSRVEIDVPATHHAGTFFYHPHKHGSATLQFYGGMAGAMIVEGDVDQVPEIAAARDVVMVINELQVDKDGKGPTGFSNPLFAQLNPTSLLTLNGQVNPIIVMRPGEVQRWRLVQGCALIYAELGLEGHAFNVISQDGITYPRVRQQDRLLITPGQRFDVLVKAGRPGLYRLLKYNDCRTFQPVAKPGGFDPSTLTTLATVFVLDERGVDMSLPTNLPAPFRHIEDAEIVGRRTIRFTFENMGGVPMFFMSNGESGPITQFDPERVDHYLKVGTAEEWTILNESFVEVLGGRAQGGFDHPFHIHTNAFEVIEQSGVRLDTPIFMDTVNVEGRLDPNDPNFNIDPCGRPVTQARNDRTVIRLRFEDFTGKTVQHCHLLNHEDTGMMQTIEYI